MLRYLSLLVVSLPLAVKTEMASNMVGNTACSQNHVYFSILCIEIRYVAFNSHLSYILHDFATKPLIS